MEINLFCTSRFLVHANNYFWFLFNHQLVKRERRKGQTFLYPLCTIWRIAVKFRFLAGKLHIYCPVFCDYNCHEIRKNIWPCMCGSVCVPVYLLPHFNYRSFVKLLLRVKDPLWFLFFRIFLAIFACLFFHMNFSMTLT